MKKWIWIVPLAICVVGGGAWYADQRVKQAIGRQVVNVLSQPSSQKAINQLLNKYGKDSTKKQGSSAKSAAKSDSTSASGVSVTSVASGSKTDGARSTGGATGSSSSGGAPSSAASGSPGNSGTASSGQGQSDLPVFTSRQQIEQYAISHFTTAELVYYSKMYADKGALTTAQKNQLKQDILSHFTPGEITDMEQAAAKYP